jgi:hypothetical protein
VAPEAAVARLAEIIAARAEFIEDDVYAAMSAAGIPDPVADRAYQFTQTAWGGAFLDGLGVRFGTDYLCFDAAGEVIESGRLTDQPYFAAAVRLVPQYSRTPGFQRFVLMSADVNSVNSALHAGSKPENLVMGPAAFFMAAPTAAGMDKARRLLSQRASGGGKPGSSAAREPAATKKPWWRFW